LPSPPPSSLTLSSSLSLTFRLLLLLQPLLLLSPPLLLPLLRCNHGEHATE
jgi:hypothetical protein